MTAGAALIRECVEYAYCGWPGRNTVARAKMTRQLRELRKMDPAAFDRDFARLLASRTAG